MDQTYYVGHSRSRTSSSSVFPINSPTQKQVPMRSPSSYDDHVSPSLDTFTTTSSGPYSVPPAAFRVSPSADLRRSTSSRSGDPSIQSSGYVAALRRQKATVWCDRFQDPIRSFFDANSGKRNSAGSGGGASATLVAVAPSGSAAKATAKIRHHGRLPIPEFTPGENHVGVSGVPLRLSATEVEAESSDDDLPAISSGLHRRTGSSRSSSTSIRRTATYRPGQRGQRWSEGSDSTVEGYLKETPPGVGTARTSSVTTILDDTASGRAESTGSGSFGERGDSVAELGNATRLATTNSQLHSSVVKERRTLDDVKRRGSVDERTATMTAGRLFIANPD